MENSRVTKEDIYPEESKSELIPPSQPMSMEQAEV